MIVFNLGCDAGHRFEGWFASTDEYERQRSGELLECPVCGVTTVSRLPSAPRLNLAAPTPAAQDTGASASLPANTEEAANQTRMLAARTAFYEQMRRALQNSDDVGERFAEEARRIHYKETAERQIHGVATREETAELLDEGVAVLPLPMHLRRRNKLN